MGERKTVISGGLLGNPLNKAHSTALFKGSGTSKVKGT